MNNSILLIDKPYNWSSNFSLIQIKKIFNIKKAGYSGTLDRLATGILPIFINESTKYSKYFSESNKSYNVIIYLGISTDTYDGSGKITYYGKINFSFNKLKNVINKFLGNINQITPMYSSFKYKGFRIRNFIGKNKEFFIKRCVTIYNIDIKYWYKNFLELEIYCSRGTYIRSIVNSIGVILKCGAYVFSLRRTKILNYTLNNSNILNFNKIYKNINFSEKYINNLINFYKINFYIQ